MKFSGQVIIICIADGSAGRYEQKLIHSIFQIYIGFMVYNFFFMHDWVFTTFSEWIRETLLA